VPYVQLTAVAVFGYQTVLYKSYVMPGFRFDFSKNPNENYYIDKNAEWFEIFI